MKTIRIIAGYSNCMNIWAIATTMTISLFLLGGLEAGVYADSDGSKSCPFKGDKSIHDKSELDYSEKHHSEKISSTSFDEQQLPSWLKLNAKWWATGQLNDNEFAAGIKFLIENDVITISENQVSQTSSLELHTPHWIKSTAGWWADGLVSDTEFVSGLEHLVNNGII